MRRIVIAAPTGYMLEWSSCSLARLASKVNAVILYGDRATRDNIERVVGTVRPSVFIGSGHGLDCVYTAYNLEPVISVKWGECRENLNLDLLRGAHVYLNSCHVGSKLGHILVERGSLSFGGSSDDFLFFIGSPPCSDIDSMAVFIADHEYASRISRGSTPLDAHRARLAKYDELIRYYTIGAGSRRFYAPLISRLLEVDRSIAVYYRSPSRVTQVEHGEPTSKPAPISPLLLAVIGVGLASVIAKTRNKPY